VEFWKDLLRKMAARLPEPILEEDAERFTQLPLRYPELQAAYDRHEASFWTAKEIDYAADLRDWEKLSADERFFIENILAFFATADGIVLENLVTQFCSEVKATEARNFYAFQAAMENVHGMTYAFLLDTLVRDEVRKKELFAGISTIPCVQRKAEWALKWVSAERPFEERLLAFAVVEGVFFSGSFCAIFWLKNRGKMVKALGHSNELIARDEGLHTDFAVLLYGYLNNRVPEERAYEIVSEAVDIETTFICESLPCRLVGMNSEMMGSYVRFVADRILVQLGYAPIYRASNPFPFMELAMLDGKTNFFEKRVSEYSLASDTVSSRAGEWRLPAEF